jgi:transposase InsO family protein
VEKAQFPVALLCRVLDVTRGGYYAWVGRPPSPRTRRDEQLTVHIREAHRQSRGTYGSTRVRRDLVGRGFAVGRRRIARLMRLDGLAGCHPRRFRNTTDSAHSQPIAPNVVARRFTATAPNQLWVTDITYVRTWEGWLYLAVIIDVFSRRVVGWAMADHLRTELILDALAMALGERLPGKGLVHHSDRGCQYASGDYRARLKSRGILCSMSRRGNCWDNAMAESFFATLKNELIYRQTWTTKRQARSAIAEYLVCFYNSHRRHSALGYMSPMQYERDHAQLDRAA